MHRVRGQTKHEETGLSPSALHDDGACCRLQRPRENEIAVGLEWMRVRIGGKRRGEATEER